MTPVILSGIPRLRSLFAAINGREQRDVDFRLTFSGTRWEASLTIPGKDMIASEPAIDGDQAIASLQTNVEKAAVVRIERLSAILQSRPFRRVPR